MSEKKYVAYVGSYTHGSSRQGIHVYDVDVENGTLTERSSVEVSNASHMAVSKNGKSDDFFIIKKISRPTLYRSGFDSGHD